MSICIIPARGGSKRIPNKNIRTFHGKPIIEHSIDLAWDSELFSRVIVSTDSAEIAAVVEHKCDIHYRSWEDPEGAVGTQEVASRVVERVCSDPREIVCVLYATSPLVMVEDLTRAHAVSRTTGNYCFSVGKNPFRDAGAFYFGSVLDYIHRIPLINPNTRIYPLPDNRVCDINTETDWRYAELLYQRMKEDT